MFLKDFFEEVNFEKGVSKRQHKPSMQRVKLNDRWKETISAKMTEIKLNGTTKLKKKLFFSSLFVVLEDLDSLSAIVVCW